MTTKDIHLKRLIKLARYLGKHHLKDVLLNREKQYHSDRKGATIEHFSWALEHLPRLFGEWRDNEDGSPSLLPYNYLNTLSAAGAWFNLNFDSLSHLFVPGYQDPAYGGRMLCEDARPSDLVHNIYEYVDIMEKQQKKQQTKIYKLKTQNHEERENTSSMLRMWA